VDREEAKQVERSLRAGHLTFDDFLVQIRQLRSMGPVAGVIEMLPGAGELKGHLAGSDPEAEVRKMEAMILSMTRRERARPDIIDGSRRRRIAAGSGTQVVDVNRLLKAREQMQQLVRQLGLGGGGGRRRRGGRGMGGLGRLLGG
jgi:signal recognition particle subunit SRP54